jgi:hypothetical protein
MKNYNTFEIKILFDRQVCDLTRRTFRANNQQRTRMNPMKGFTQTDLDDFKMKKSSGPRVVLSHKLPF